MPSDHGVPLPLAEACIFLMAFLELSDDDTVDPDRAVTAMENAGAALLRLPGSQRVAVARHAEHLAGQESDPRMVQFLHDFADGSGLLDDA